MDCVLKDLIEISKDGEWGKGEPFDDSIEMLAIRGTDFEAARVGQLDSVPRRHVARRNAERKTLRPWDLIIEAAGGTKGQITGRTVLLRPSLFNRSELPLTCASFSRFIRLRTDLCFPEYVFWHLQYLYGAGFMHAYHTQHTGVARFQWTTFSEREVLTLPSLPTQKKIAAVLSAYDDLIENNERRIRILEEMAQSLYREWFVKFRFPGHKKMVDSQLGKIPECWEVCLVGDLVRRLKQTSRYDQKNLSDEGAVPVIDQSEQDILGYHNNMPDFSASPSSPVIIFGDHTCKMEMLIIPFSIGPNVVPFVARNDVPITYLFYIVRNLVSTREYKRHWTELMAKEVIHASKDISTAFCEHVTSMLEMKTFLRKRNRVLRQTRDLLLPKLISGEVDVSKLDIKVPEDAA